MGAGYTIGTVPYLNARPLVRWFWDTEEGRASGVRVVEAVPSGLAAMLERVEVDAALVSSIELFRAPDLCHAAGVGVVADGPVRSVRMLSKVPIGQVRTVALDTSSLTSVALLKILLSERYGLTPEYHHAAPDLAAMLEAADAALLIGDLGYREYDPWLHVLDLGEAWKDQTGLPFLYAAWIGHPDRVTPALVSLLLRAKEWGSAHREQIAAAEYRRLDESYERSLRYLTEVMRYDVGPCEEEALRLFGAKAYRHGLVAIEPTAASCRAIAPEKAA
jgi:chorismate dehydratase